MLRTGATVSMMITVLLTTIATIGTTVSAVTTLRTLTALATFTGRTLNVTFGLLDQYTVRELVLTRLRVDLQQFHLDLVAFLDTSLLDGLKALPVDL